MPVDRKSFLYVSIATALSILFLFFTANIYAGLLLAVFAVIFAGYASQAGKNVYFLLFMVAFFTFLLGHPIVKEILHDDRAYYSVSISQEIDNYTYVVLLISILSVLVGYKLAGIPIKGISIVSEDSKKGKNDGVIKVERFTYYLSVVSLMCLIIENTETIIYVQMVGYLSSYLGYTSRLPGVVGQISAMVPVIFAMYLATLPEKRNARLPIILYMIAMGMNLFAGKRFEAVAAVLLLILYATYRNKTDEEKWIKRGHIIFLLVLAPIAVGFLTLMTSWRAGSTGKDIGAGLLIDFMSGVGNSSQLISYEKMYHNELASRNVLFSFGNVWRSLNGNALAQMLGVSTSYGSQTVENALYGHSLSSAIMYKINPSRMLAGGGLGSCYIAELMCDFSYYGVVIGNLLIGFLLKKLNTLRQNHLIANFVTIFMATSLFRLPRDSFDYFFYQMIGIKSILFFVVIYIVYHQKTSSTIKVEETAEGQI